VPLPATTFTASPSICGYGPPVSPQCSTTAALLPVRYIENAIAGRRRRGQRPAPSMRSGPNRKAEPMLTIEVDVPDGVWSRRQRYELARSLTATRLLDDPAPGGSRTDPGVL